MVAWQPQLLLRPRSLSPRPCGHSPNAACCSSCILAVGLRTVQSPVANILAPVHIFYSLTVTIALHIPLSPGYRVLLCSNRPIPRTIFCHVHFLCNHFFVLLSLNRLSPPLISRSSPFLHHPIAGTKQAAFAPNVGRPPWQ